MKFRWITLPLVGAAVLFAHDGAASNVLQKEEVIRRLRSQKKQTNDAVLAEKLDLDALVDRFVQPENDTGTDKRQLLNEDAWWHTFVRNTFANSFSMTDPPTTDSPTTAPPVTTPIPTFLPTTKPTEKPVPSPSPTDATDIPTKFPTLKPTDDVTGTPTTQSPEQTPTNAPVTGSPTGSPTPGATTEPPTDDTACSVTVDIACETEDGVECQSLEATNRVCSGEGGGFKDLRFMYTYEPCQDNNQALAATCDDFAAPTGPVRISCTGYDGSVIKTNFEDMEVEDNEVIMLVSESGFLSDTTTCEVGSPEGEIYQILSFDTSGAFDLKLKDKFGSLQLEACSNGLSQLDCMTTVCFEYTVQNVGMNGLTITELLRTVGEESMSILEWLPATELAAGDSTIAVEKELIDLCIENEFNIKTEVTAFSPSDIACESQDKYSFSTKFTCDVDLDLSCQLFDDSFVGACSDLEGEQFPQCVCEECPRELVFKYTAIPCDDVGSPGVIACIDEGPLPESAASISVATDTETLFNGILDRGEEMTIRRQDKSCLPDTIMIITSDLNDLSTASQIITLDTSCSTPQLTLASNFGAVEFSGYTCSDDVPHNCYVDAQYKMVATNSGFANQILTKFDFTLNGITQNLLEGLSDEERALTPSQGISKSVPVVLERCLGAEYVATGLVDGNDGECSAEDILTVGPFEPGTPSPSQPPTDSPQETPSPIQVDSPSPTGAPSSSPVITPPPAQVGSPSPSSSPTSSPVATVSPTPVASPAPTIAPSKSPVETESPTQAPSPMPSGSSSIPPIITEPPVPVTPTQAPSPPPSGDVEQPTVSPSQGTIAPTTSSTPPTGPCVLEVSTLCTPPVGSGSCTAIQTDTSLCESRPVKIQFQYNGGGCDESLNSQGSPQFQCEDYSGGPPTEEGTASYIVVTDVKGKGIVYFAGWAEVGGSIELSDSGREFEDNQNVTIYSSNVTVPESILQTMAYHSSCSESSSSLSLKDRFGAVQLAGFSNEAQGEISCFTSAFFDLEVSVPVDATGQIVTITSMVTEYSIAPGEEGVFNFTSELAGREISSGGAPETVDLSIDIDLTTRRTYNVFTKVSGISATGQQCEGSDLYQFAAGQPPPPVNPTAATPAPTISPAPTTVPEETPCELVAVLTCDVMSGRPRTCEDIQMPSEVTCTGDLSPSSLRFQYTGDRCPVNPQNYECTDTDLNMGAARESVFIEVADVDRIIFGGVLRLNQFFTASGTFGDSTTITLYTVVNEGRGDQLQRLDIITDCNSESDLTLLNRYGALELTGFANAVMGEQSIEAQINLVYAVKNGGFQAATVNSALIIDAFDGGPIELVDSPFMLQPNEQQVLFQNEQILNLRLKEQLGRVDTFFLSVRGSAEANNLVCSDTEQLTF